MISFETSVRIGRPIEEVFDFVSNPLSLPQWNSAVAVAYGPLTARAVRRGVDANFAALKGTLDASPRDARSASERK